MSNACDFRLLISWVCLKKNLAFRMVLKKFQWLLNITKDSQRFPKNAKCGCTKRQILAPPYQDYAYPYLGKITEARYQEILLRSHKKTWHSKWCVRSSNDLQTSPKIPNDFQRMSLKCGSTKRQNLGTTLARSCISILGEITEARCQEILLRSHMSLQDNLFGQFSS